MLLQVIAPIPSKFSFTTDTGECQTIHIGDPTDNENLEDGQSATQEQALTGTRYLVRFPDPHYVVAQFSLEARNSELFKGNH